jgi:hypothetical protein
MAGERPVSIGVRKGLGEAIVIVPGLSKIIKTRKVWAELRLAPRSKSMQNKLQRIEAISPSAEKRLW